MATPRLEGIHFVKKIGSGVAATVWLVEKDCQTLACKVIPRSGTDVSSFENEARAMNRIYHSNVIQLIDLASDDENFYLFQEYCSKGDLFDYVIKRRYLLEYIAKMFVKQLLTTLQFLHQKGVFHNDLKPENILIDSTGQMKICDFGLSSVFDLKTKKCENNLNSGNNESCGNDENDGNNGKIILNNLNSSNEEKIEEEIDEIEEKEKFCGSSCYAAPEVLEKKAYNPRKSDIWSLGMCFFAMLTGQTPWRSQAEEEILEQMKKHEFSVPKWLSLPCQDFLSRFLVVDPKKRISIEDALRHKWLESATTITKSRSNNIKGIKTQRMSVFQIDNFFGRSPSNIKLSNSIEGNEVIKNHIISIINFLKSSPNEQNESNNVIHENNNNTIEGKGNNTDKIQKIQKNMMKIGIPVNYVQCLVIEKEKKRNKRIDSKAIKKEIKKIMKSVDLFDVV